jgi:hypothetical protein
MAREDICARTSAKRATWPEFAALFTIVPMDAPFQALCAFVLLASTSATLFAFAAGVI